MNFARRIPFRGVNKAYGVIYVSFRASVHTNNLELNEKIP